MATEIELKLVFEPAEARAILGWPGWREFKAGQARTRSLYSKYFDTPDRALARAGAALRVRQVDRRWIQTFKIGGESSGAVDVRREHEWVVPGEDCVVEHLRALDLPRGLRKIDWAAMQPVFVTRFERKAFAVKLGEQASAEAAIDLGTIESRGRTIPIAEIEIELRSGAISDLFPIATRLIDALPLRLGWASKAERGYALADRVPLRPVRSQLPAFEAKTPAVGAARLLVGHCLRHLQSNEAGFSTRTDREYLHQMRVALRRLRVALRTFAPLFPPDDYGAVRTDLRRLAAVLGPARDWDVWCTETWPRMQRSAAAIEGVDPHAIERIRRRAMSLRAAARKAARAAVGDRRYTRLILACARLLAAIDESAPGAVQPVAEHAREWVDRCHKRLRDRADEPILEEALHEVRLTAKKLRYSVDFFGDVVREAKRKRAVRYGDALARLQDVLGVINDAAVARRLLGALIGRGPIDPQTIAVLRGWLAGGEAVERVPLQGTLDAWRRCPPFWRSG